MIIRPNGSSRLAITQPDHAALAGRIVNAWRANGLDDSPRRDDIVLATAEHDNGWKEVDDALLVDPATGAILDFMTVPTHIRQGVWARAVSRLSHRPYAAALVAHHAQHVYSRYRSDRTWTPFFAEMEQAREAHLRAALVPLEQMISDYLFVRIGDLASLTFCTAAAMQVGEFGYTVRLAGPRVIVDPDPFAGAELPLSIEGQEIDGYTYARAVTVTGAATGP